VLLTGGKAPILSPGLNLLSTLYSLDLLHYQTGGTEIINQRRSGRKHYCCNHIKPTIKPAGFHASIYFPWFAG